MVLSTTIPIFVWYKDDTGEGVSCNKEQLNHWFANFWKNKQSEAL